MHKTDRWVGESPGDIEPFGKETQAWKCVKILSPIKQQSLITNFHGFKLRIQWFGCLSITAVCGRHNEIENVHAPAKGKRTPNKSSQDWTTWRHLLLTARRSFFFCCCVVSFAIFAIWILRFARNAARWWMMTIILFVLTSMNDYANSVGRCRRKDSLIMLPLLFLSLRLQRCWKDLL